MRDPWMVTRPRSSLAFTVSNTSRRAGCCELGTVPGVTPKENFQRPPWGKQSSILERRPASPFGRGVSPDTHLPHALSSCLRFPLSSLASSGSPSEKLWGSVNFPASSLPVFSQHRELSRWPALARTQQTHLPLSSTGLSQAPPLDSQRRTEAGTRTSATQ